MSELKNNLGNKKPLIYVPVDKIELDSKNPRLIPYLPEPDKASQFDLLKVLFEYFDTEAIALSLIENGYFEEEPIIIVPNKLSKKINFSSFTNSDKLKTKINDLINENQIMFTVVEGNRRVASIKLLLDYSLRNKLGIEKYYPKLNKPDIIKDISTIPCIFYENREDIFAYLGVRHIAGLLKWEAFAQAVYTADVIEIEMKKGLDIREAVKQVQKVVGDRSDKILKQYITYKLFLQARDDIDFDVKPIINYFSLLTVAYNSPSIREYLGVEIYSKVDLNSTIVNTKNLGKFQNILTWIYGNKRTGELPVLTDSRRITDTLSHIVTSEEAIEYLQEYKDIEGAFERTNGERVYLSKKLTGAIRAIQTSLKFAYKFKNDNEDLLKQVAELEELIEVLKENLT